MTDVKVESGADTSQSNGNRSESEARQATQWPTMPHGANEQSFNDHCRQDGKWCIVLGDLPLRTLTERVLGILRRANQAERFIFQRSGKLVTIRSVKRERDRDGQLVLEKIIAEIDIDTLRSMLTERINFVQVRANGQSVHVDPPLNLLKNILVLGDWPFPVLAGITEVPVLRKDGSVLLDPGYDRTTQLLYIPSNTVEMPKPPDHPSQQDAKEAVWVLREAIGDFPFDSQASEANAIAALITPIVRPAIQGHVPFELIDATRAGTGKSKLADIKAYTATGRKAAFKTPPESPGEWRKIITTTLMEGTTVNIIDNVRAKIDSAALDALITAHAWSDRLLGGNENVTLPNKGVWAATGNNITIGGDLPRRCYIIRLDAGVAKPWKRTGSPPIYDEPEYNFDTDKYDQIEIEPAHEFIDLDAWLPENRGRIIAAILTIARAWYIAGQPQGNALPVFGSFEEWTRIIGGMLAYAEVSGFLGNLDSFQDEADYESWQWKRFLQALKGQFGDDFFTTAEIASFVFYTNSNGVTELIEENPLAQALPDFTTDRKPSMTDFKKRLGIAFNKRKGTVYDDETKLCLTRGPDDNRSRSATWSVGVKKPVRSRR
jgi:hypothetical protein